MKRPKEPQANSLHTHAVSYPCLMGESTDCSPWTLDNGKPNPDALKFIGVGCDVSSEISVQKAYAEIMETYGRIDSVVASAGDYQINPQTRHRLTISRYCGELFRF